MADSNGIERILLIFPWWVLLLSLYILIDNLRGLKEKNHER